MNSQYLSREQLERQGFADLGEDVLLHVSCVIVGADKISIGSHVRIDPFCIITIGDRLTIGSRVHISGHVSIFGRGPIDICDFANVSHGVRIFSSTDSFTAGGLVGPMVPDELRQVTSEPVVIGRHAMIGVNAVILPGTRIGEGAAVGALSLARSHIEPWTVNLGVPSRVIGQRDRCRTLGRERLLAERAEAGRCP